MGAINGSGVTAWLAQNSVMTITVPPTDINFQGDIEKSSEPEVRTWEQGVGTASISDETQFHLIRWRCRVAGMANGSQ